MTINAILSRLLGNYLATFVIGWLIVLRTQILRSIKSKEQKRIHPLLSIREFSQRGFHLFFGYYDVTPFSTDEKYLLAVLAPLNNKSPGLDVEIKIGYFDLDSGIANSFNVCDATTTWCWQQGCRLQWYPSTTEKTILYNRTVEGQYGAVIQDISTGEVFQTYNRPIYALSRDGRWGLSLNFSRLQRLRPGYGYNVLPDLTTGSSAPDDDGIWLVDMESGESRLIISLADMANREKKGDGDSAESEHYFNHLCFNPKGDRILFFHIRDNRGKRIIRMITSDRNGKNLYPLETSGMVSHFSWVSDNELIVFARSDQGLGYYLYRDQTGEKRRIAPDLLKEDGHPSYSPDGRFLLTDTYPDRFGNQHLLLFNNATNQIQKLGSFFRPSRYKGETRCDLHPRWSPSGKYVAFDSTHTGKRSLYVLDLNNSFYG